VVVRGEALPPCMIRLRPNGLGESPNEMNVVTTILYTSVGDETAITGQQIHVTIPKSRSYTRGQGIQGSFA